VQVAHSLEIRHLVAYMNLSQTCGVARLELPLSAVGQTVSEIEAGRPDMSIILIQRSDLLLPRPANDELLNKGDIVLVAGLDEAIDAFADS
jgi:Trk K+ transport system NAD-binding subunit